jgi:hypothetical protein
LDQRKGIDFSTYSVLLRKARVAPYLLCLIFPASSPWNLDTLKLGEDDDFHRGAKGLFFAEDLSKMIGLWYNIRQAPDPAPCPAGLRWVTVLVSNQ